MLRHEHFKELCALAAANKLPPSRVQEFETHLDVCDACAELVAEHRQLHWAVIEPISYEMEALAQKSRERVRAAMWGSIAEVDRERADTQAGTVASAVAATGRPERRHSPLLWITASTAAALALACIWLGAELHRNAKKPEMATTRVVQPHAREKVTQVAALPDIDSAKTELEEQVAKVTQALKLEHQHSEELQQKLGSQQREAVATQASLKEQIGSQETAVKTIKAELEAKRTALEQAQSTSTADAATIANLRLQEHDLNQRVTTESANLDRERDLFSHNREIRDIIGARNLHIIDVFDTSGEGAPRKPFARAFYTEGKSLVYYAYDLPQRKADEGFSYVAWGENNGNKATIRKIGLLFHDDQTQRRWSFNFSDPQVLHEIDSVFITMERNGDDLNQPKGKRMLTAYLGSPANHP